MMSANWKADCPKCVASKFTCDDHYRPEIECPQCGGDGSLVTITEDGVHEVADCRACAGEGWRPMTDDEIEAAAERQAEEAASEPPVTMAEQHRAAWDQKQALRS